VLYFFCSSSGSNALPSTMLIIGNEKPHDPSTVKDGVPLP
jgi:hypothetical protein